MKEAPLYTRGLHCEFVVRSVEIEPHFAFAVSPAARRLLEVDGVGGLVTLHDDFHRLPIVATADDLNLRLHPNLQLVYGF